MSKEILKEQVLVIPRESLGPFIDFRGFKPAADLKPESWYADCSFLDREAMEIDPSFKQLIPYIVLRCDERVFRYHRTKRGGESRLHYRYSIGIGGHVNPRDENLFTPPEEVLLEAAMRELREEVKVDSEFKLALVGFLNDDSEDVGKVHLGIVYEAWLESDHVEINESALNRGEWISLSSMNDGVEYETWSQFVIDDYLLNK